MAAGRPRKPTALRELQGGRTRPHHSPSEPKPDVRVPDKPAWLIEDKVANGLYDEVADYVVRMQVGTEVDGIALGLLADQLALYIEIREQVRREGAIIDSEGSKGQMVQKAHPGMALMTQCVNNIHKFLREYSLTAASRSSLATDLEKPVNDLDDFMNL